MSGVATAAVVGTVAGGYLASQATKSAANTSADAQRYAADQAAQAAAFRPVGVTTGFGSSTFGYDPYGTLESAGYTLTPEMQSIRDRLVSQAGAATPEQMAAATQGMYGTAGGMFNLAGQLMPTGTDRNISPEAQALAQRYSGVSAALMPSTFQTGASPAAQAYAENLRQTALQLAPKTYDTTQAANTYMTQQQAVLEASRQQQLDALRNQLAQSGRGGLSVGGSGTMQASNPELAAYYNSLQQQNLGLAATATDVARQRLYQDVAASTGLQGQALTAEQQAEEIARSNMLQNTALSLGYGTSGYQTQVAGEDIARQRYAQDLGLATGLYSTGAGMLSQIPQLQSGAYAPLQTQLGLASSVENLGQGALDISSTLAGRQSTAGAAAGQALLTGGMSAAKTTQAANQYSPWAAALTGFGQQAASPTSGLNSWFNNMINYGGTQQGAYGQQGTYLQSIPSSGGTQQQQMLAAQNEGLF